MQIEKLLEEQEKDFDRKCEIREDKGGFTYLYERDDHLSSEAMFDWHKQSLKQFIDGLVDREEKEMINVIGDCSDIFNDEAMYKCHEVHKNDDIWNRAKKQTIKRLKEITKQLE